MAFLWRSSIERKCGFSQKLQSSKNDLKLERDGFKNLNVFIFREVLQKFKTRKRIALQSSKNDRFCTNSCQKSKLKEEKRQCEELTRRSDENQ